MNARAIVVTAMLGAGSLLAQDPMFDVAERGDGPLVSANRTGVPGDQALRELGAAMGWGVEFETEQLRGRMSVTGVDLAFSAQNPRIVAGLVAVASGGDVIFNDRSELGEQQTTLMVVSPAAPNTESGRQRLRRRAIHWYRTFLQDELEFDPLVVEHGMDARMHMAKLLKEQGALHEAALVYAEVQRRDPSHDYVPAALLALAECRFELGEEYWDEAERAVRDLRLRHPSLPQAAAGTVLLGKILLARKRYEECVKTMTASYLRLAGTPEIIDLYLIVGKAEFELRNPENVLRTMNILDGGHEFRDLDREQWLDYLFLRGYALHALGKHDDAVEALELFLGAGQDDRRRGIAFILLGRTYLAMERFVQARAAAIEAHYLKAGGQLDGYWSREASKFYARTALEIGDREVAFEKLEVEVRRSPESEPELVIYLAQAFMEERRYQKAIITCDLIADLQNDWGDQARLIRIEAMWAQALAAGPAGIRAFPERAIEHTKNIQDKQRLQRISEIFGRAYEMNGEIDKAADAYRGLLRWD
ncbi:MAG: tetratricopeptide repeat protein [Planctomycetes bacterium]|nr:tetratricopeptide repeat protein [Planctomycetota bacterium]